MRLERSKEGRTCTSDAGVRFVRVRGTGRPVAGPPPGSGWLRPTTYDDLRRLVGVFMSQANASLLLVSGRSGVGKSQTVQAAVSGADPGAFVQRGTRLSPVRLFIEGYHHRPHALVLDDIMGGGTLAREEGEYRALLAALCERGKPARVSWATQTRELAEAGVPDTFHTYSPVLIIRNSWQVDEAIASRANFRLYFDPGNLEVHRYAATWFHDQQVHDFIGQHLAALPPIDCRWYEDAVALRAAYPETWRDEFLRAHGASPDVVAVLRLEADPNYPGREARCARWVEEMRRINGQLGRGTVSASRATYMRLLAILRANGRLDAARTATPMRLPRAGVPPRTATLASCEALDRGEALPPPEASVARAAFTAPVTGTPPPGTQPPATPARTRPVLDDSLPWEPSEAALAEEQGDDDG